jgi:FdhD protein
MKGRLRRRLVRRYREGAWTIGRESIVAEEPLEIRLIPWGDRPPGLTVTVTMRTPGQDFELAAGFLWTEGILPGRDALRRISYCVLSGEERYNIVNAWLHPGVSVDPDRFRRHFPLSSSCGVCGRASLEGVLGRIAQVKSSGGPEPPPSASHHSPAVLAALPARLREAQLLFAETGGLHAAGLFGPDGTLLAVREDVGRHNALDKLLGWAFLSGHSLKDCGLVLSGRTSFDLMQKAAVAGVKLVVAVGAPSSLAIDLAEAAGITLLGWVREGRLTVYTGSLDD